MHLSSLLMHIIRARFQFRPDPIGRDPTVDREISLARIEPDREKLARLECRNQGLDFGTRLGTRQYPLGIERRDPREASLVACLANGLGIERRIAQHHHGSPFRQRQLANQLSRNFGLFAKRPVLFLTIVFGIKRFAEWHADPAGRDQQAHHKAMATLGGEFVLAIASSLARASLAIARTISIFAFLPLLAM